MKLSKAIEILADLEHDLDEPEVADRQEATKLGREALKRFSVARKNNIDIFPALLLGEDPE